jgi:hypothetical protein
MNGAKEIIAGVLARLSDFFHANENDLDQGPSGPDALPPHPPASLPESPSDSPSEPPLEWSPGSLQLPEPTPFANSKSLFWRVDGSKVILEFDPENVPGFDATRKVVTWASYWYGVLFRNGSGAGWVGELYWLRALLPAALGGLEHDFVGRVGGICRGEKLLGRSRGRSRRLWSLAKRSEGPKPTHIVSASFASFSAQNSGLLTVRQSKPSSANLI